jgi:plasmid stability protein
MKKMIQIRNVPEALHKKLKARAAMEGMSLSDFLLAEITRCADRPTTTELRERLGKGTRFVPDTPPAQLVREGRDFRAIICSYSGFGN